jgi:hypothetical protein
MNPGARNHLRTWKFQIERIKSDFASWLDGSMEAIDAVLIEKWRAEHRASSGWLNLTEAARFIGISARTLRLAVQRVSLVILVLAVVAAFMQLLVHFLAR